MEANLETGTKICSRCKQELPLDQFYTDINSKDGYRAQCKECSKQSSKEAARRMRENRRLDKEATKALKEDKSYRKLTLVEKKKLLLDLRSNNPLTAYHPRELFEYLASLGYKISAEFTQKLNFG